MIQGFMTFQNDEKDVNRLTLVVGSRHNLVHFSSHCSPLPQHPDHHITHSNSSKENPYILSKRAVNINYERKQIIETSP